MNNCEKSGNFYKNISKVIPPKFKVISEGMADVIYEDVKKVFYNKVQVFNRDVSILVIQQFLKDSSFAEVNILEALAATGLRSIRYWKEIEGISAITCNDLEPAAFESIKRNVDHNEISRKHVIPNLGDCNNVMWDSWKNKKFFEVVDLDPYGSAIPYLATSIKAVQNNGLLCVTCTDLAVLCGSQRGACFGKYGLYPHKTKACHELALRTLLASIQRMASIEKKVIEPLLCLYVDFYVRIFVRVKTSAKGVRDVHEKHSFLFSCTRCNSFKFVSMNESVYGKTAYPNPVCEECDSRVTVSGPTYAGPIHDSLFIERLLKLLEERGEKKISTYKRIKGILTIAKDEIPEAPLFFHLPNVCSVFQCGCPKSVIVKSALLNLGFRVSRTHCTSDGLKTNAPAKVVFDLFRTYVKGRIGKEYGDLEKKSELANRIMAKEITTKIDFSIHESLKKNRRKENVKAFFPNPEKYWGPKSRATGEKKITKNENGGKLEDVELVGKKRKREILEEEEEEELEGESQKKKSKKE